MEGLHEIWAGKLLTNGGPVLQRFERHLAAFLQTSNISVFANGALALQVAFQGMRLEGEVITTPFSFVATTNALTQCRLTPVFADIEPSFLTLDPDRVEAMITARTSAILAVHAFGLPCDLGRLQAIADRHGLALIYDAAHAFGTTVGGRSVADFGDVTMFSFHATKVFHSIEGGALIFEDGALRHRFDELRNHGLTSDGDVRYPGLNAKMSELHALMGELMLPAVPAMIAHGAVLEATYRECLSGTGGLSFLAIPPPDVRPNHSFMPVLVREREFGLSADRLQSELGRYNVFARRYFHPLISDMTAFRAYVRASDPLACAKRAVTEVLALPIFTELTVDHVVRICDLVKALQRGHVARSEKIAVG